MRERLIGILAIGLVVAALARELRMPAAERTWTGKVAGVVPYDFRRPTLDTVRNTVWAPDNQRILTPHAFGVGWSVNLGRVVRLATGPAAKR